ncbi:hypothetical protein C7974DRAFT_52 [Boeremia exigua]|uniref:uncharacterized protein n=1 Tax=Boeremia exigua TaxID=749465 RepID=UPI001E8DCBD5|nr:uncharacterized protein C7974DRAFT_52 [Boeremia exigua]KAH6643495.1 hypothetical protein C7974DRAFT_52 [Boeremia exigua]
MHVSVSSFRNLRTLSLTTKVSSSKIVSTYQLRAAHTLYSDTSRSSVIIKGDILGFVRLTYGKSEDGSWKFAGLVPTVYGGRYSSIEETTGAVAARVDSGEIVD